ncbi:MAG: hypothetical protein KAT65_07205, partial [Methanophagales archaeon]|nr:hypothetical protein [Methanophagales archaeon]
MKGKAALLPLVMVGILVLGVATFGPIQVVAAYEPDWSWLAYTPKPHNWSALEGVHEQHDWSALEGVHEPHDWSALEGV